MNDRRFVDCGNGTVTDQVTGLIWLKNAACLGFWDFAAAHGAAATLQAGQCGLSDNSTAGDWRLPTGDEWRRTIEQRCAGSPRSPAMTDNSGTLCYLAVSDGTGVFERALLNVGYYYWTSELIPPLDFVKPQLAGLAINLDTGQGYALDTTSLLKAWAVR
jgi:hypothetical protein